MKVLLSSIGSRGDVQPLLALALELRARGQEPRLCVPPNFKEWVESYGIACIPIGPDLKQTASAADAPNPPPKPSPEQLRQLAAHTVRGQFAVLSEAARACDLIVGGGALQIATRSIAETLRIPYIFVGYCPAIFPSPDHPPPKIESHHSQWLPAQENLALWAAEEQQWNELFCTTLNEEREKAGLAPVENVLRYLLTDRPWLAADPAIAPPPSAPGLQIVTSGAWFLPDQRSLPDPLEQFLASGAPPVYFGLGSMRAPGSTARIMIEAAREAGHRVVLSQGWANLMPIDAGADCLVIGDINHEKLFPRVAAVVHHGGAGTTTAATRAGCSQVVLPQIYDQYYWAHRVQELGVGVSGPTREQLNMETLVAALRESLQPEITARAQSLAGHVEKDGARIAAEEIVDEFG